MQASARPAGRGDNGAMSRALRGSAIGVAAALALGAVLIPLRAHMAIATAALVLVLPVVAGVAMGGWAAGLVSVLAGFLVYDFAFTPPYYTLTVGTLQDWVALAVYVIVMIFVARLVAHLRDAEDAADSRAAGARHLLEVSELLLAEHSALGETNVAAVHDAFGIEGVALLQPVGGRLEVVASAGTVIAARELDRIRPESRLPVPLSTGPPHGELQTLALASSGRPVGLLALRNAPMDRATRELLPILANHLAIALERGQLQEQALRAELLEEVDELRRALMGAVSHDLRTPLATIKVASSTLADPTHQLSAGDIGELSGLIELQADRLTRLVANLLDMSRIQAGALELRRKAIELRELVDDALLSLGAALRERRVVRRLPPSLLVDVDPLLISQVLANLLDNANRHGPAGTPITVTGARAAPGEATVSVTDCGPGVPAGEWESVFNSFVRFDTGGRSGLGLAIARAFVEAHGERIWVEDAPGGGARFSFTVALAAEQAAAAG